MFEGILMAIAIFIGIPALALVVFIGIEKYFDRQIQRESDRAYWRAQGVIPPAWSND